MHPAKFYTSKEGNKVQCGLCRHKCLIEAGQTGICQARKNVKGELKSLVYGYPAAFNIDPVEKKPFYHFYPGSYAYSLGTYGCNFRCKNCQNYDLSQAESIEKIIGKMDYLDPGRVVENALANDCAAIAYTYNEPTIFTEYALDIMELARRHGLKNIWISNGFMSEQCLGAILPYLDAANIDLKSMENEFYVENCGAFAAPVLENLRRLKLEQVHLEITTLLIPGLSTEVSMLEEMADFIVNDLDSDTPWHLSRFSPEISWKLRDLPATGDDVIYEAHEIGKNAGLKYVYVGNIPGDQKENTYCPRCGELAIRRFGYHLERFDVGGHCPACDRSLDIIE